MEVKHGDDIRNLPDLARSFSKSTKTSGTSLAVHLQFVYKVTAWDPSEQRPETRFSIVTPVWKKMVVQQGTQCETWLASFLHKQNKSLPSQSLLYLTKTFVSPRVSLNLLEPSPSEETDIVNEPWLRNPLVPENILHIPRALSWHSSSIGFIYFLFNALTSFYRLLQSNKWFLSELLLWGFSSPSDFGRVSESLNGKATKLWEHPGPYIQLSSSKKSQLQMPHTKQREGKKIKAPSSPSGPAWAPGKQSESVTVYRLAK